MSTIIHLGNVPELNSTTYPAPPGMEHRMYHHGFPGFQSCTSPSADVLPWQQASWAVPCD